jgi:predicted transcriptional regulator
MLTKRNKSERMTIVNTLLTGIYEELLKGETDDINGLLQIAVYAQVEMNRIVDRLNQLNGCEPQTDCPSCETCKHKGESWSGEHCYNCYGRSEYEPQTDCGWK